MSVPCDRTGIARVGIAEYGLVPSDRSASVAISLRAQILELWNGEDWDEWEQYDMEVTGQLWIVKSDGTYMAAKIEDLVRHAGWDGTLESVRDKTWQPTKCQVSIEAEDDQKGNTRYRIGFVNAYDRIPGQIKTATDAQARQIIDRHAAGIRAIAANVKRNAPSPANGKPAAPPAGARPAPPPAAKQPSAAGSGENIPF